MKNQIYRVICLASVGGFIFVSIKFGFKAPLFLIEDRFGLDYRLLLILAQIMWTGFAAILFAGGVGDKPGLKKLLLISAVRLIVVYLVFAGLTVLGLSILSLFFDFSSKLNIVIVALHVGGYFYCAISLYLLLRAALGSGEGDCIELSSRMTFELLASMAVACTIIGRVVKAIASFFASEVEGAIDSIGENPKDNPHTPWCDNGSRTFTNSGDAYYDHLKKMGYDDGTAYLLTQKRNDETNRGEH